MLKTNLGSNRPLMRDGVVRPENLGRAAIDFLKAHRLTLAIFAMLGMGLGIAHLLMATWVYTASSAFLIDDSKVDVFQRPAVVSDPVADNSFVESQIEVLRSDTVMLEVARLMAGTTLPVSKPSLVDTVLAPLQNLAKLISGAKSEPGDKPAVEMSPEEKFAAAIGPMLNIRRVGLTFVVSISVSTSDPLFAQRLANAVPQAYINVDRRSRQESTQQTILWLEDRLGELRQKSAEADQAVETFKRDKAQGSVDRGVLNSQLRQLESLATSYKSLYDSLQTRYLQAVQEESFTRSKGRIISPAALPRIKSWPKGSLSLALGLLGGLFMGVAFSILYDVLKVSPEDVARFEDETGLECLATLEPLKLPKGTNRPEAVVMRTVITEPFSHYSEEIRRVAHRITRRREASDRVTTVGVISLFPKEGKSTISSNLAHSLRLAGHRTVLVDLDLRNPSLSRTYNPPATAPSILDKIERPEAIWVDPSTRLAFTPNRSSAKGDKALLSGVDIDVLSQNFAVLGGNFDFAVCDIPPLRVVAEAEAIKPLIDMFVLVVNAESTDATLVQQTIDRFDGDRSQIIGAILNQSRAALTDQSKTYHYSRN